MISRNSRHDQDDASDWLQLNLRLRRRKGQALDSARALFEQLEPWLVDARARGLLRGMFLMRKPPDVRLRLRRGADVADARLTREATALVDRLRERRIIAWGALAPYEPEIDVFGGAAAMQRLHAYFEVDSAAWMRRELLLAAGTAKLGLATFSIGVLNDLFAATLEDENEIWQVWCRLARLNRVDVRATGGAGMPLVTVAELLPRAGRAELPMLRRYQSAHRRLGAQLRQLAQRGGMSAGLRSVLTFTAQFHWNRFGLSPAARPALLEAMVRGLDPHRVLA